MSSMYIHIYIMRYVYTYINNCIHIYIHKRHTMYSIFVGSYTYTNKCIFLYMDSVSIPMLMGSTSSNMSKWKQGSKDDVVQWEISRNLFRVVFSVFFLPLSIWDLLLSNAGLLAQAMPMVMKQTCWVKEFCLICPYFSLQIENDTLW